MHAAAAMCVTNDYANFATLVIKTTGHHSPDGVIHNSHDICIVVLMEEQNITWTIWLLWKTLCLSLVRLYQLISQGTEDKFCLNTTAHLFKYHRFRLPVS